jgi:hypothetical protein
MAVIARASGAYALAGQGERYEGRSRSDAVALPSHGLDEQLDRRTGGAVWTALAALGAMASRAGFHGKAASLRGRKAKMNEDERPTQTLFSLAAP